MHQDIKEYTEERRGRGEGEGEGDAGGFTLITLWDIIFETEVKLGRCVEQFSPT